VKPSLLILLVWIAYSAAGAAPALGSTMSVYNSKFCAVERCRFVGLNDSLDSFGYVHYCGADYDFYHYRLRNGYGLYEYRTPGNKDTYDAKGRPNFDPKKNPVIGFQLESLAGWPVSPADPESQLVSRLIEYATRVRAPFTISKPYRAWQKMNARLKADGFDLISMVTLPILKKYVLILDFGHFGTDRQTGELVSYGPRISVFVGTSGFLSC
jgi:hypothetical protein